MIDINWHVMGSSKELLSLGRPMKAPFSFFKLKTLSHSTKLNLHLMDSNLSFSES